MGPLEPGGLGESEDRALDEGSAGPDTHPSVCVKRHSSRPVLRPEPDQNLGCSIFQPMLDFKFFRSRTVFIPLPLHLSPPSPLCHEQRVTQSRPTRCLWNAANKFVKLLFLFCIHRSHLMN